MLGYQQLADDEWKEKKSEEEKFLSVTSSPSNTAASWRGPPDPPHLEYETRGSSSGQPSIDDDMDLPALDYGKLVSYIFSTTVTKVITPNRELDTYSVFTIAQPPQKSGCLIERSINRADSWSI